MNLSPWHSGVLFAGAALSTPALWAAFVEGTLPVDQALTRFLLCVLLSWVVLNVALPLLVPQQLPRPAGLGAESEEHAGEAVGEGHAAS